MQFNQTAKSSKARKADSRRNRHQTRSQSRTVTRALNLYLKVAR